MFLQEGSTKKYVGVPGMNSICKSLCSEDGVVAKFGVTVGKMDWLQDRSSWSLASLDGKDLGNFDYVVATDKNVGSPRFSGLTGRPPPLGLFYNLHNVNQHEIRFNSVQYYNLRHLVLEGKLLVSR